MTESHEQVALIKWTQQPSVRSIYPELKYLFHIPNENRDVAQVAILKAMGVKKGVPDLFLPVPRGAFHGMFIEMKTKSGKASDAQKWWLKEMIDQGYNAVICYSWEDAKEELLWYLKLT